MKESIFFYIVFGIFACALVFGLIMLAKKILKLNKSFMFYISSAVFLLLIFLTVVVSIDTIRLFENAKYVKSNIIPQKIIAEGFFNEEDYINSEKTIKADKSGFCWDFDKLDSTIYDGGLFIKNIKKHSDEIFISYVIINEDSNTTSDDFYIVGVMKYEVKSGQIKICPILENI